MTSDTRRRAFHWQDVPSRALRRGVNRRVFATPDLLLSYHEIQSAMEARPHSHADFNQVALVLQGAAHYYLADEPFLMEAGSVLFIPAGTDHWIEPLDGPVVNLDLFAPPRADLLPEAVRYGVAPDGK